MAEWKKWSPLFAPHVVGEYETREFDPKTGLPEPQKIKVVCGKCGDKWQTTCSSGQVRVHISRFGMVHLHRDPLG